jgi:hypothetical protein
MSVSKVEVLSDGLCTIECGWVAPGVLFVRVAGKLTAGMGTTFAQRVSQFVKEVPSLQYFGEATQLTEYDLVARSAFVRVVLENRKRFAGLTVLTWAEGVSTMARALVSAVGEPVDILSDRSDFEARLLRAAPQARERLLSAPRDHGQQRPHPRV